MLLRTTVAATCFAFGLGACTPADRPTEPADPGLLRVRDLAPGIVFEMRYAGANNFTGEKVPGYEAPDCLLTRPAAAALAGVQSDLANRGLGLIVWDCYRPQRAVDAFMRWADDPDQRGRERWYPNVAKSALVKEGYIAERSGHSRGSTADLGLVRPDSDGTPQPLDLGTPFDFFDPRAHTDAPGLSAEHQANRQVLVQAMPARGFVNYPKEWWHYTLRDEPWPETVFDVPVR